MNQYKHGPVFAFRIFIPLISLGLNEQRIYGFHTVHPATQFECRQLGRLPSGGFPSRYLPVGFRAGRVAQRRRNGEKWRFADRRLALTHI
jgi:hypothetical protein